MYKYIKSLLDFLVSLVLLIIFSPLLLIITISLCLSNKFKPFFIQKRPGKGGEIFGIVKFKTMNDNRDSNGNLLPDQYRITWIGSFIRKTSLDEIPQLINVLKGDMSIIGPRPLLIEYLELYSEEQKKRHLIKPGITGWAQVNGRNAISWREKFSLDIYYVDNISFALDVKIIYYTIIKVFKREGVNASDEITMEAFNGEN